MKNNSLIGWLGLSMPCFGQQVLVINIFKGRGAKENSLSGIQLITGNDFQDDFIQKFRVTSTSMNFTRKKKQASRFTSQPIHLSWLSESVSPDPDESELLYECIRALNDINKMIILLYLDGNSHSEIAAITGISVTNVGTRIGRIKEELKHLITKNNK